MCEVVSRELRTALRYAGVASAEYGHPDDGLKMLQLAHHAITDVTKLGSVRVRGQLAPLTQALEARPGSDAQDLARMARQAAA